jgi:hypothetical protein
MIVNEDKKAMQLQSNAGAICEGKLLNALKKCVS